MKIRRAAGAVVFQNNEYLLVHKVKNADINEKIIGHWDFPKGGVEELDEDFESGILRELKEETGSTNYRIINMFDTKICFSFPKSYKYERQETVMFYVEYLGNREELKPQDDEIDQLKFFSKDDLMKILYHEETIKFLNEIFDKI